MKDINVLIIDLYKNKGENYEKNFSQIISCFYASGFVHKNHSTATVALRDDAISSSIEGITISNFWNSQ